MLGQGPYFVGVDAGTSRIKAAVLDLTGQQVAFCELVLAPEVPFDGASEVDMELVWQAVRSVLQTVVFQLGPAAADIAGVGVTGQGDGLWPLDRAGRPVRKAILWNDSRAGEIISAEGQERIDAICGQTESTRLFAGANGVILKWLQTAEPDTAARIHWVLHCKDWINYRLTGEIATDRSDASTAMTNRRQGSYVDRLAEALGIADLGIKWPKVLASDAVVGQITVAVSAETGIPEGTPVIAGAIDLAAAAVGLGAVRPRDRATILGTTVSNQVVLDEDSLVALQPEGTVLAHAKPDRYLALMAANAGTPNLDWVKGLLGVESYGALEAMASEAPLGAGGVIFHPYLNGERAPFRDARARASFFGLGPQHGREHLARAVYEGVALSVVDCYASLPRGEGPICLAGGGARSAVWCQMISDALGAPVAVASREELGITGIVALAMSATGFEFGADHATGWRRYEPDRERHRSYQDLYDVYRGLRGVFPPFWAARKELLRKL